MSDCTRRLWISSVVQDWKKRREYRTRFTLLVTLSKWGFHDKKGNCDWLETNLGVPQGSVPGPLLFYIYVNDLRDTLDGCTIKHIFYADDLQIDLHTTKDKILEGISRLSDAAKMVSEWAGNSGLRLNGDKTRAKFLDRGKMLMI